MRSGIIQAVDVIPGHGGSQRHLGRVGVVGAIRIGLRHGRRLADLRLVTSGSEQRTGPLEGPFGVTLGHIENLRCELP